MKKLLVVFAIVFLCANIGFSQTVNIPLRITNNTAIGIDTMYFGLDPIATDGIDAALGEYELPPLPPSEIFDVRFIGSDITPPPALLGGVKKDYRTGTSTFVGIKKHELTFQRGTGTVIKIYSNFPTGIKAAVYDLFGGVIVKDTLVGVDSVIITNAGITKVFFDAIYDLSGPTPPDAPVLMSPTNGSTGVLLTPLLDWSDVTGALTYRVQVSTDSLFSSTVLDTAGLLASQFLIPTGKLLANSRYYWRANASNSAGAGAWSTKYYFNTLTASGPAVNIPLRITNNTATGIDTMYFGLDPTATDGIDAALGEYELPPLPPSEIFDVRFIGSDITPPPALLGGVRRDYRTGTLSYIGIKKHELTFQRGTGTVIKIYSNFPTGVKAAVYDLFGGVIVNDTLAGVDSVIILNAGITKVFFDAIYSLSSPVPPDAPNLLLPANGSIGVSISPSLDWNDVPTATSYKLQVSANSGFTSFVINDSSLTASQYTVPSGVLSYNVQYYWRVYAKNTVGYGPASTVFNFTTILPMPLAPGLLFPVNNSTGNELNLNLVWNKPQYSAGYNVVLATDAGFTTIILNDSLLTDSIKALTNLTPLTNYYWKVRAKNAAGWGVFSTAFTFKTVGIPTQVVLSIPVNNATGQPVNLTFKWFKAVDQVLNLSMGNSKKGNESDGPTAVTNYWFELATDSMFTNIISRDSILTDTTKSVTSLMNITNYFWRVKAKNQIGWAVFSSTWKFTTIVPIPGVPGLISPANNSQGNPLNLNLEWNKPQYSAGYNVVLATDAGFTTIILNDSLLTDSIKTLTNLTPLTNYYWKVRAKNAAGWGVFSTAFTFKTIGPPTPVVLSIPVNNATGQPINLTFKWFKAVDQVLNLSIGNSKKGNDSDGPTAVTNYWFELATDSMFTNIISRDSILTDTTKSVTSLLNITNYFWRVKAKNQVGWTVFSSTWKFTTIVPIPVAPVLLLPANNSTGVSLTPLLDWTVVQYSASYRIQVSADSSFSTTLWDTSGVVPSQVNIPANKLTGLTKYYWKVNAANSAGTGSWSVVWNFKTLQNLTLNLKVYLEGFWNGTAQVSDTTMVYLANPTTPFAFVDSAKVVLSATGTALTNFTKVTNGSYYIVVKHRNHLETWSKLPQAFVTNLASAYDFTTAANKAFGDNMKQVGSVWVLYGGDANRDGAVDALDAVMFISQFGITGYFSCDFNGDGAVDALDVPIIVANFGLGKAFPTLDVQLPLNIKKEKVIEEIQKRFKLNGESEKKETFKKTENKLN